MRSNNSLWALAPLLVAACGGGYRDPPGLEPAPQQQQPRNYPLAPDYPTSVDPRYSGPGTSYPAPGEQPREQPRQQMPQNMPARDLGPDDAYTGADTPPPSTYPPQSYPPQNYPAQNYPAQNNYPPATYPPARTPPPTRDYPSVAPPAQLPADQRYDNVGYAGWASQAGTIAAAHRVLPPGSFVEVTALDTGKTIVVPITARASSNREIELSGAAAQLLGLTGSNAAVRVRRIVPTAADQNRLRAGQPAEPRFDTPPVLLRALRSRLTQGAAPPPPVEEPTYRPSTPRPSSPQRAPAPQRQTPGYYVQLAALSTNARAAALAREAGATVRQQGALWLVRSGPFEDLRTAQAARDDLARRGYGDARIVKE